jgi:signal transduction histidine kinase
VSASTSPASLLQRLRVTKKFAALGCVVLITVLLLLYSLVGTLNRQIKSTENELAGGKATLAIMKLIQVAQQHRGLSSMLIVGESQLAEKRAAKQAEVDALFKNVDAALPASNRSSEHWKRITDDWADIRTDGLDWIGAQSFNAHTGLINDLLDLQISVADDSGLVLDPDAGSRYLIETGIIKLPLLLERLGRLRGKGATALTQQRTPPQTRVDFSVLDVEINNLLRETESDVKKVVRHAPALEAPLGVAIRTMHEVSDQVLQIVAADILHERFKMPPADYFALTTSAIDAGYIQLYENIYPSLNQLLEARIEAAQTGRKLSVAACVIVFAVLFYLMIADVAARKRAEDSLREFNATLEQKIVERTETLRKALADLGSAQDRLSQIIDGSPVVTFVLDRDHRITHWNRACEVLTEVSAATALGTREAWRPFYDSARPTMADLIVSGETGGQVDRFYADTWRRSEIIEGAYEAEGFFPNFGETGRWLYFTAAPLRDSMGKVIGAIETLRDITEQRQAEAALNERAAALQQALKDLGDVIENLEQTQDELVRSEKLAALGSMVAGVAHELNTPIGNSLMVASHLVETSHKMKESLKTGLKKSILDAFLVDTDTAGDVLVRNLSKAAELVSSFKQVAVDQTSSQRRSFNLAEMVAEIVTTLGPSIRMTPYLIEQNIPDDITMDSFPGPLGQVVTNLINNGILHGFDGRENGRICIEADRPGGSGQVVLKISDDGKGIPANVLPRIFDPFFTTRLGQGGSGLGLNIVHNIVFGVLGGRISADSVPGEGSCFTLALPLSAPEQGGAEKPV